MPPSLPGQLCHWGPIIALSLISLVTVSVSYSAIQLYGLPTVKYIKTTNFVVMYSELAWILYVYYRALKGPGYVPHNWTPVSFSRKRVRIDVLVYFLLSAVIKIHNNRYEP